MTRRPVASEETSSPVTLSEAKGLGMDPHNHRDASLALSVTCAMFLRSEAKNLGIRRGEMLRYAQHDMCYSVTFAVVPKAKGAWA